MCWQPTFPRWIAILLGRTTEGQPSKPVTPSARGGLPDRKTRALATYSHYALLRVQQADPGTIWSYQGLGGRSRKSSVRRARRRQSQGAVAFHRLGRIRDRGTENQQARAAAPNPVTAAIILSNSRYLGGAIDQLRTRGAPDIEFTCNQISPLGWGHINLIGDYVFSENSNLDQDGFLPLKMQFE
jgi:hypothetical protein